VDFLRHCTHSEDISLNVCIMDRRAPLIDTLVKNAEVRRHMTSVRRRPWQRAKNEAGTKGNEADESDKRNTGDGARRDSSLVAGRGGPFGTATTTFRVVVAAIYEMRLERLLGTSKYSGSTLTGFSGRVESGTPRARPGNPTRLRREEPPSLLREWLLPSRKVEYEEEAGTGTRASPTTYNLPGPWYGHGTKIEAADRRDRILLLLSRTRRRIVLSVCCNHSLPPHHDRSRRPRGTGGLADDDPLAAAAAASVGSLRGRRGSVPSVGTLEVLELVPCQPSANGSEFREKCAGIRMAATGPTERSCRSRASRYCRSVAMSLQSVIIH
jgi:hypothetical protein